MNGEKNVFIKDKWWCHYFSWQECQTIFMGDEIFPPCLASPPPRSGTVCIVHPPPSQPLPPAGPNPLGWIVRRSERTKENKRRGTLEMLPELVQQSTGVVLETGELALKTGVLVLETGVLVFKAGVLVLETGVLVLKTGVFVLETGVLILEMGVLVLETGVLVLETCALGLKTGVLVLETGVLVLKTGVLVLETGVFVLETGVLVFKTSCYSSCQYVGYQDRCVSPPDRCIGVLVTCVTVHMTGSIVLMTVCERCDKPRADVSFVTGLRDVTDLKTEVLILVKTDKPCDRFDSPCDSLHEIFLSLWQVC